MNKICMDWFLINRKQYKKQIISKLLIENNLKQKKIKK